MVDEVQQQLQAVASRQARPPWPLLDLHCCVMTCTVSGARLQLAAGAGAGAGPGGGSGAAEAQAGSDGGVENISAGQGAQVCAAAAPRSR